MKQTNEPQYYPPPVGQGNMISLNNLVRKQKGGEKTAVIPKKPAATTQRGAVVLCKKILCKWTGEYGVRAPLISVVKVVCGCGKSKEGMAVAFRDSDNKVWKAVVSVCKNCGKPRAKKKKSKPKKKPRTNLNYLYVNLYDEF